MAHNNKNFAIAYLFLVALPVVGLVGVLRSGRNLTAPTAIGGLWKVEHVNGALVTVTCGTSSSPDQDLVLAISQSGPNFTLKLANLPASSGVGAIVGTAVRADIF